MNDKIAAQNFMAITSDKEDCRFFNCISCPNRIANSSEPLIEDTFVDLSLESVKVRENITHTYNSDNYLSSTLSHCNGFVVVEKERLPVVVNAPLQYSDKIDAILESSQNAEHELCTVCTSNLHKLMIENLTESDREIAMNSEYVAGLEESNICERINDDLISLEKQLYEVTQEEMSMLKELAELDQHNWHATIEIASKRLEKAELNRFLDEFVQKESVQKARELEAMIEYESLKCTVERYQRHLDRANEDNLLSTVFVISTSKLIASINDCRIGCLPEEIVQWSEINLGFGQLCLCILTIANLLMYKFTDYEVVPMARQSYILISATNEKLLLHSNGFNELNTRFDAGISALLQCVEQLHQHIKRMDSDFQLPHLMEKTSIKSVAGDDYSIGKQLNTEQNWTMALKFLLINMHSTLHWSSVKRKLIMQL